MTAVATKTVEPATPTRRDVYAEITGKIVAQLEMGVRPWAKPWNAAHAAGPISRPLRACGEKYRGINVLALWIEAELRGFSSPYFMSFKQALDQGGHVRKGERGSLVVYSNTLTVKDQADDGEDIEKSVYVLRHYSVFNAEQIEGLPERFYAKPEPGGNADERHAAAEAFVANTKANIRHGGNSAYYNPGEDRIQLPEFTSFRDAASYYSTACHELSHWTRHKSRLARDFGQKRFGDTAYAREELTAELSAAFLCSDLGIAATVRDDHACYLGDWLQVLKNDSLAVFAAAAHAQRAADYLHALQPAANAAAA